MFNQDEKFFALSWSRDNLDFYLSRIFAHPTVCSYHCFLGAIRFAHISEFITTDEYAYLYAASFALLE